MSDIIRDTVRECRAAYAAVTGVPGEQARLTPVPAPVGCVSSEVAS